MSHAFYKKKLTIFARIISIMNFLFFGIEIAMRCEIAPGLCFPHTIGTVIGAQRIGRNALIYHGVTLGAKEMDINYCPEMRPIVGDNVIIGSGAKVLGGIIIGNNVVIGANAVVTHSIPDNATVGGIPARVLRTKGRKGN
jgi:serine O-acetyltransferase